MEEINVVPVSLRTHRESFFDALVALEINEIQVSFAGSGDDGQIHNIDVDGSVPRYEFNLDTEMPSDFQKTHRYDREKKVHVLGPFPMSIYDAASELAYEIMELAGTDFNDEGCHGTIVFNVADRSIRSQIQWPIITYSAEELVI
jgi:hypothetical protein